MKILKNLDWVYEVVNEYANIEIINKGSIIYGGIIRDIIAKKTPEGDIDLAILTTELINQIECLANSCKWKKVQKSIETLTFEKEKYKPHTYSTKPKSNMDFICEYKNNNKVLQLIATEDITKLICDVDFICCGIGMDCNGNIIEYIDGAYNDCINHKLRLNTNHSRPNILITKFKRRLTKLIKRGWEPCNISRDRKILYKKTYIKKQKSKKQPDKVMYTRKDFINENLYYSSLANKIIIHNILFKHSKIGFKDVYKTITSVFGIESMPSIIHKITNDSNHDMYINYTMGKLKYMKRFFECNLPQSIKDVYTKDDVENIKSRKKVKIWKMSEKEWAPLKIKKIKLSRKEKLFDKSPHKIKINKQFYDKFKKTYDIQNVQDVYESFKSISNIYNTDTLKKKEITNQSYSKNQIYVKSYS